jgi:hypothetical protein
MSATPDNTPAIQSTTTTPTPQTAMLSSDYLALVARACPIYRGPLPTARHGINHLTLYKVRPGATVEVWFRRITPTKFPELRVGVVFASDRAEVNAEAAGKFEARFAEELKALGFEPWTSDTNCDRRFTTPIPVPMPGADLGAFASRAAELAARYVELLKQIEGLKVAAGSEAR